MKRLRIYIATMCLLLCTFGVQGRQVRLYGYVVDTENVGIEFANVYLQGTTVGTTTNKNGYYDLQADCADSVTLVFSMIGYQTIEQPIRLTRDIVNINVELPTDAEALAEIEVRGINRTGTMEHVDALTTRSLPSAAGGIESLLITFSGVSQNNELSTQYNVRGGSFDENSVYVNGIEIHRPLLVRQSQQEGLSFVNPDMTQDVAFSAGGFDAQYGDKMSSVLDITYKRPTEVESSLSLSLMGATAYVGFGNERHSQMHGIRYKTSRYMLWSMDTKGAYNPNFLDYQTYMTWRAGSKVNLSLLGNVAVNSYAFRPTSTEINSGTMADPRTCRFEYTGEEKDLFNTAFAAFAVNVRPRKDLVLNFTASGFYTNEQERYDIAGEYKLSRGGMNADGTLPSESKPGEGEQTELLGHGWYMEHARNMLQSAVVAVQHDGEWASGQSRLKWGASVQTEMIRDGINEWQWRDSVGYSLPNVPDYLPLYYSLKGTAQMQSVRGQAYVQESYKWNLPNCDVLLTGGVRLNYWSYNREPLISPRASLVLTPGFKHDLSFRIATGLYYQAPYYKELRDTLTDEYGILRIALNDKLKAQRSVHVLAAMDYYFRAWGRPFKFTAEAYYKYIDRMVSYTVENVRVTYSGKNDAEGYTTGLDLKLYGELVPGADSWISLSLMRSRERIVNDPYARGWMIGSNEQRYAFTMFFQDYIPKFPKYRAHLKFIVADGLPLSVQGMPKLRNAKHMPNYMRLDLGASRVIRRGSDKMLNKCKHLDAIWIQAEVLNLLGNRNVNSYMNLSAYDGSVWLVPNYLTGRRFNVRLTFDFK